MTFMVVVVAVLATLVGVLMIWVGVRVGRWAVRRWRERKSGWWKVDWKKWMGSLGFKGKGGKSAETCEQVQGDERRPLLG